MIEQDGKFLVTFAFDSLDQALDFEMYVANGRVPPESALQGAELAYAHLEADVARVVNANVASNVQGTLTQVGQLHVSERKKEQ